MRIEGYRRERWHRNNWDRLATAIGCILGGGMVCFVAYVVWGWI